MEPWLATVLSLIGSTIISAAVTAVVKRAVDKKLDKSDKDRQELSELHRQQRKEDVANTVKEEIKPLVNKMNSLEDKLDKISEGTLSSLRNDILTCYYKCNEKGYRNDYDYTNIHDLYDAYVELHGNSFIADVMARFDHLPIKEEIKREIKRKNTQKTNKNK